MLDHIGRVADDARNEDLSGRKLCVLPHLPLVLVAWIGPLDHVSPDLHLEDQIHDVLKGYIAGVRTRPAAPADVIADTVGRQPVNGVIENIDLIGERRAVVRENWRWH